MKNWTKTWLMVAVMSVCGATIGAQAQVKVCMSYNDYKANKDKIPPFRAYISVNKVGDAHELLLEEETAS